MKTNVNMVRMMGSFTVTQRTKDGKFNATTLLDQWNNSNPNDKRRLDNFWQSTNLIELMNEIAENELNFKYVDSTELESDQNQPNFKSLKFGELKKVLTDIKRGRHNSGTWMHPYLFIKFAMYLAPKFEYSVIKFVYDELIKNRHLAGDNYKKLSSSIARLKGVVNYQEVAKALNYIVFGKHESGIRNTASDEQLRDLQELEGSLSLMIDARLVQTFDQLLEAMRGIWALRHPVCAF